MNTGREHKGNRGGMGVGSNCTLYVLCYWIELYIVHDVYLLFLPNLYWGRIRIPENAFICNFSCSRLEASPLLLYERTSWGQ